MKVKCSRHNEISANHFFLLMIAPLLIGLIITFTSFAHAEWNQTEDPLLQISPKKQGWMQMGKEDPSQQNSKSPKKIVKAASSVS